MKLAEKVRLARLVAAEMLEVFEYLNVVESEHTEHLDGGLQCEIYDIITNALAAEVRGK